MNIEKITDAKMIETLIKLEQSKHNPNGYSVKEVLRELNIEITDKTQKQYRAKLRSMIDKKISPEFATAGNKDIVYCPNGKNSGTYRLSEYHRK